MRNKVEVIHSIPGRTRLRIPRSNIRTAKMEAQLRQISSIYSAVYTPETSTLLLHHHPAVSCEDIVSCIQLKLAKRFEPAQEKTTKGPFEMKKHLFYIGLATSAFLIDKMLFPGAARLGWAKLFNLPALTTLFVTKDIISNGLKSVITTRQANADTLTTTALAASILKGSPGSALLIVILSNISELLTEYTAERTRNHITSMLKLDVSYAWRVDENGKEQKVQIESIKPGDTVSVFLGEKVAVDGEIVEGLGAIDESSMTGEFLPREVSEGSFVYAGSILKSGRIRIKVKNAGDETAIHRIIQLIEEAQSKQAPIQNMADRLASKLVPVSFLMALVVYLTTKNWDRVLNMLFIDFSCGLKLSTATAISAAIGNAAKSGILVKGGQYIERLAQVDTIILDKTGTLTEGRPAVQQVIPYSGHSEQEVIRYAASAEEHSSHPIAESILKQAKQWNLAIPRYDFLQTIVGRGLDAMVEEKSIQVGSKIFMEERDIDLSILDLNHRHDENNAVYVACDGKLMGILHIHDPVRTGMNKAIHRLRREGIDEVLMLTGDRKQVAQKISASLFLDHYYAEALPSDKAELVKMFKRKGASVMMVGDGVNDAPALAYADVGVTMGGKRTDIAVEASDVTITSDDPMALSSVVHLSKHTIKTIQQNFMGTIVINSAAMLLGAIGAINPVTGAVIHNTATIAVVLNSTRILLMKLHRQKS